MFTPTIQQFLELQPDRHHFWHPAVKDGKLVWEWSPQSRDFNDTICMHVRNLRGERLSLKCWSSQIAITFRCGIITSRLGFPTQFRSRFLFCRNFLQQPSAFFHSYICPFWRYLLYSGKRCVFWPIGQVQLTAASAWFCSTLPTCKQLTKYTTGTHRERDWSSRYVIPTRFT